MFEDVDGAARRAPGSRTVLVVEDDIDIQDTLRIVLEEEGYRVFTAAHGREGLAVLDRIGAPCLVLLDLMMPVMSGWEMLDRMRASAATRAYPVIVITAAGDKEKPTGADELVRKPVSLDKLLRLVMHYCG